MMTTFLPLRRGGLNLKVQSPPFRRFWHHYMLALVTNDATLVWSDSVYHDRLQIVFNNSDGKKYILYNINIFNFKVEVGGLTR